MSIILRIVELQPEPEIKEYFLGFLVVEETTGKNLSTVIRVKDLQIDFMDCRSQSYDNGSNMKGKKQGVQTRLLEKNPRALFVPCGAHTLNLVLADAAKA